ncbi:MAG TPA: PH domain-containing protein [Bryobacteraceae bacterium]|nr:PH domain-containing protein [Bryobacteraceae bacterium]
MSSEETGEFAASYDTTTRIVSGAVCAGTVLAAATAMAAAHNIIVGCLVLTLLPITYVYSPRGYKVAGRSIVVKRLIGSVTVPLEGLRAARRINADDLRGCIHLGGSGGLFGYFGLFRTSSLGRCTWYVTNRKNAVVVIGASKTTVYSPDDVDGFLAAVSESPS